MTELELKDLITDIQNKKAEIPECEQENKPCFYKPAGRVRGSLFVSAKRMCR